MTNYRFVVLANAVPGRQDEFNEWYDNDHLGDILAVEGFEAAQRFRRVDKPGSADPADGPYEYLAIYEVETDDPERLLALLGVQATKSQSDAIDLGRTVAWWFEEIAGRRTS